MFDVTNMLLYGCWIHLCAILFHHCMTKHLFLQCDVTFASDSQSCVPGQVSKHSPTMKHNFLPHVSKNGDSLMKTMSAMSATCFCVSKTLFGTGAQFSITGMGLALTVDHFALQNLVHRPSVQF